MKNFRLVSPILPNRRHKRITIGIIDNLSIIQLVMIGIGTYMLIVLVSTLFELLSINYFGLTVAKDHVSDIVEFWDLMYFNTITILTVGYGDYAPVGIGRIISVLESLLGLIVFGAFIGVFVMKLMLPQKDTIVFSDYCYFDYSTSRFFVQFVNTTNIPLINTKICSLLTIDGKWTTNPSYEVPYIGSSVWTIATNTIDREGEKDIYDSFRSLVIKKNDGVKLSISGTVGFAEFSSAVKYTFDKIIVLKNISTLSENALLNTPNFSNKDFCDAFNFKNEDSQTFIQLAKQLKSHIDEDVAY